MIDELNRKLDEWEAVASGREGTAYHSWTYVPHTNALGGAVVPPIADDWRDGGYVPVSEHIALHDPAAVLGLVAGLRAAVEEHGPHYEWPGDPEPTCSTCVSDHGGIRDEWEPDPWPCHTLAAIAGALGLDAGGAE